MSYRVVIVDDERYICSLIKGLIDYQENSIEIIKIFDEGEACLQYILETRPDIVISDIQIGDWSGLDIIRQVREQGLDVCFILISGYNYFEYAKQAIQYGVESYLLKPIQKKELNTALKKTIRKIAEKRGKEEIIKEIANQKREKDEKIFLHDLWNDKRITMLSEKELEEKYELGFTGDYFALGIVHIDSNEKTLYPSIIQALRNALEEKEYSNAVAYYGGRNIYFALNTELPADDPVLRVLKGYWRQVTETYLKSEMKLTISVSSLKIWGDGQRTSAEAVRSGIYSRIRMKKGIITEKDVNYQENRSGDLEKAFIDKKIAGLVETLSVDKIREYCMEVFRKSLKSDCLYEVAEVSETVIECLHKNIEKVLDSRDTILPEKMDCLESSDQNVRDFFSSYTRKIDSLLDCLQANTNEPELKVVAVIKEYLSQNYSKHIDMDSLAELVYLTPAYLGIQFKKQTGKSIKEYLMQLRMEKAKELLGKIEYNISDVAFSVGFSDAKYFAKAFKEYVGVKPTEYRKIQLRLGRT